MHGRIPIPLRAVVLQGNDAAVFARSGAAGHDVPMLFCEVTALNRIRTHLRLAEGPSTLPG